MTFYGSKNLADSFRTVRKNTLTIANEIPEEQYGYKATPDVMSVGEMLAHLATSTHWADLCHFVENKSNVVMEDFGRWMGEGGAKAKALTSKAQILQALKADGEKFAQCMERMSEQQLGETVALPNGSKSRFEMLLGVKEHEMHHRAQLFLIERMVGIVPHLTRARQERMAQQAAAR